MAGLLLGAPLLATMVLPAAELRACWELAHSILHSIRELALVEMFSRWRCNITARSFSAAVLFNTPGSIAPLSHASSGMARSISDLILCPTPGFNRLQLNLTIAFLWAASSPT